MSPFLIRLIVGILLVILGFSMVYKTNAFLGMLGILPWAEKTFGGGGTRTFYKLVGVFFTFMGFIIMTNLVERIFGPLLRLVFRY